MSQPAYVRHAIAAATAASFTQYPSVQIDHGTGDNRVLLAWVYQDAGDAGTDFVSCYAGCTASGSQSGGTAMTPAGVATTFSAGTKSARLFYLAGASLPTGTSYVVGDCAINYRKPGVIAVLYDDAGGGPITVSSAGNLSASGTSHSLIVSGTTGAGNELMVGFAGVEAAITLTSPATQRVSDATWIDARVFERAGAATSTTINWTTAGAQWENGSGVVLTGAAPAGPVITGPSGAVMTGAAGQVNAFSAAAWRSL